MKTLVRTPSQRNGRVNSKQGTVDSGKIATPLMLSTFSTPLGWIGLMGDSDELISVFVGHSSRDSIRKAATIAGEFVDEADWNPSLRKIFEDYAEGNFVDFSAVQIRLPPMTPFRRRIVESTRQIRFGETVTYGELARRAGYPGAARAVGTVMSTNRFPILIPCHRVLAAGGKLGGYTAPSGTRLKQRLLDLEATVGEVGRTGVGERIRPAWRDRGRSA